MSLSISHTEKRFVNTLGVTMFVYLIFAGQVADIITTMVFASATDETGARAFPHLSEGNWLFHDAVHSGQWFDLIAIKVLASIGLGVLFLRLSRRKELGMRIAGSVGALLAAVTSWEIVIHNLRLMGVL
jgi:hypothetical protein